MQNPGLKAEGGGGRDASHGQIFHMFASMLIILSLWQARGTDKTLEYAVFLEKQNYGKWDDIVVRYKRKEDIIWTEICIQCKHASKNLELTAKDLFSAKIKAYALCEYLESYVNIRKLDLEQVERHLVFMCNKKFKFDTSHENIKINDTTFYKINICSMIFQNELFKFNLENNNLKDISKAVLNGNKKFNDYDVDLFLKDFSYCMNQNIEILQSKINEILNSVCNNDTIAVDDVYSKLYKYIHSMLTDEKYSEMTANDIDNFMTETLNHHSKNIYFEIQDPSEDFIGRTDEMIKLQNILLKSKENSIIDTVISGMAGVGKTQLILKFISEFKSKFNHILWINAESITNMQQSFMQIAVKCNLIDKDNSNIDINEIVEIVYSFFIRKGKCLFVFDNAIEYYTEDSDFNITNFLPRSVVGSELFLVVTSQNIKFKSKLQISLDVFSTKESIKFLEKLFKDIDDIPHDDLILLCKTFQNFPLALEIAASFIIQKMQFEGLLGDKYSITEFISEFKNTPSKILQEENELFNKYGKNVQNIWVMIINMFSKNSDGYIALKILKIMSFCSPDGIPTILFTYFNNIEIIKLQKILDLIRKYSLCKINQKGIAFMHRLVQDTIRNNIEKSEKEIILKSGLDLIQNHKNAKGTFEFLVYNNSQSLCHHSMSYPSLEKISLNLTQDIFECFSKYFKEYSDKFEGDSGITEIQKFLKNDDTNFIGPLNKDEFINVAELKLQKLSKDGEQLMEKLKYMANEVLPAFQKKMEEDKIIDPSLFEDIFKGFELNRNFLNNFDASLDQAISQIKGEDPLLNAKKD